MSDAAPAPCEFFSKHRLEALADGIFAVVMTLLVLEIKPELTEHADNAEVWRTLQALAVPLLSYILAFVVACAFWTLHHRKFQLLRHTNGPHTGLTLLFLFTVTLLPIFISLYLHAKGSGLARACYFGNFTLIAVTLLASWLYARRAGLIDGSHSAVPARIVQLRMITITTVGLFATVVSYFDYPYLMLLVVPVIVYVRRVRHSLRP